MYWLEHIREWAKRHKRDPKKVEKILIREGWSRNKYKPSMKQKLFNYLDEWYTLSIKSLPKPATSYKRNPLSIYVVDDIFSPDGFARTVFSNGWIIDSRPSKKGFTSVAFNKELNKETYPEKTKSLIGFVLNHHNMIDDVIAGEIS
jgi:hypothetical protein